VTIRRGQAWGENVAVPPNLLPITSDGDLARAVMRGEPRPVRLVGGDLLRTLGGPSSSGPGLQRLPIDVLRVMADGRQFVAVAHVVARRGGIFGWWRGPILAAMNADRIGRWNVAPQAHPNDGRAEIIEVGADFGLRARWQARRRLPTGTYLPHPAIATSRAKVQAWTFDRPRRLWLDGVELGTVRSLGVTVEADGAIIHI
jgi:hypothetical protein